MLDINLHLVQSASDCNLMPSDVWLVVCVGTSWNYDCHSSWELVPLLTILVERQWLGFNRMSWRPHHPYSSRSNPSKPGVKHIGRGSTRKCTGLLSVLSLFCMDAIHTCTQGQYKVYASHLSPKPNLQLDLVTGVNLSLDELRILLSRTVNLVTFASPKFDKTFVNISVFQSDASEEANLGAHVAECMLFLQQTHTFQIRLLYQGSHSKHDIIV